MTGFILRRQRTFPTRDVLLAAAGGPGILTPVAPGHLVEVAA